MSLLLKVVYLFNPSNIIRRTESSEKSARLCSFVWNDSSGCRV